MYKSYEAMLKEEPWVEWQVMNTDFELEWKPNTPQAIKEEYKAKGEINGVCI